MANVVSIQWLKENLDRTHVVIVDCRFSLADVKLGDRQYHQAHIPGAFYLDLERDLSRPVEKHGGRHPLPDAEELGQKLAAMGIDSDTLVVAYDDSRLAFAARLWWLLRYLGHDRVAVLDGGWKAWQGAGYPVSDRVPTAKLGAFTPQVRSRSAAAFAQRLAEKRRSHFAVDIDEVKERKDLPGAILVDSRERDRYLGLTEPIDPIAGHIPSAVNFPWQDVTDPQGYLHSVEELKQRWKLANSATEIIVYCGSGVTACVNLLSLELAGIKSGLLYPGSWSDWCSYIINPIETEDNIRK